MIFYTDETISIHNADCRNMFELANDSVQCVVTSPPYWGLRKYTGLPDLMWDDGWEGQLGHEPTPELYIKHLVEIFREVKRVLRPDGICFVNIGDTYSGSGGAHKLNHANPGISKSAYRDGVPHTSKNNKHPVLKPKDLCLIPQRLVIALQEDGWWVRSDIIWHKTNPMPESVKDRPTNSYEHVLMLTKSAKYFYDNEAVREPISAKYANDKRANGINRHRHYKNAKWVKEGMLQFDLSPFPHEERDMKRNMRDVWTINVKPYNGAHFATFPEELVERCIKAATSEKGCCPKCGASYIRIVERKSMVIRRTNWGEKAGNRTASSGTMISPPESRTTGWEPGCNCGEVNTVPCLVLDPFGGSGTTAYVAKKIGRRCAIYELSREYCKLAEERNRQEVL